MGHNMIEQFTQQVQCIVGQNSKEFKSLSIKIKLFWVLFLALLPPHSVTLGKLFVFTFIFFFFFIDLKGMGTNNNYLTKVWGLYLLVENGKPVCDNDLALKYLIQLLYMIQHKMISEIFFFLLRDNSRYVLRLFVLIYAMTSDTYSNEEIRGFRSFKKHQQWSFNRCQKHKQTATSQTQLG